LNLFAKQNIFASTVRHTALLATYCIIACLHHRNSRGWKSLQERTAAS